MKTKQTWWLIGVALALAAFIFVFERPKEHDRQTRSTSIITGFRPEQVAVIEVSATNLPAIRLRRSGSFWNLEAPIHYPAQFYAVERWLTLLEQAQWVARLTGEDLDRQGTTPADFGLAPPEMKVTLQQGERTITLELGNRLAVGRHCYVRVGGQPDILVADDQLLETLPRSVTGWRDTALATFSTITVSNRVTFNRVEVRPATNGYTLQLNTRGEWRITQPISARGDERLIGGFLSSIVRAWKVDAFVTDDPSADLTAYGLQAPEQELVFGRGTNDLLVIQFGSSPTNRADLVFARLLRHTNVVLTARTNLDWLRIPYSVWRDHLLADIDPRRVDEIVGHNGLTNGTYHVRRMTNDIWRITSPEALPVDTNLVAEFFQHMNSIEVVSEKDVVTDLAPYGLTEPARQFEFLSLTNGITTNAFPTLSFGVSTATNTFARRSDETAVYSIAPAAFDALPLAHWQWRDRSIWSFQTNEVRRVHITHKQRSREVLRSPEGKWLLAPGSTGVMEPDLAFDEAIFQLGQLRADRWVARGRSESIRTYYGFDSNSIHRVAIETMQGGALRTNTIEFGGVNAEGRPFAVVQLEDDEPWFFEFPMPLYYTLVKRSLTLPVTR